jgi:hypothetical protein
METGLVFNKWGAPIFWHLPPDRSSCALPDSRPLWDVLWDNRAVLGGVAHTHPWSGEANPSGIDVTTFAAVEAGLGERLVWPIVTFTEVRYFTWVGPGRLDYGDLELRRFRLAKLDIEELRDLSRQGGHHA